MSITYKLKQLVKMIIIACSPEFAERVTKNYWKNTTITHGSMEEHHFDFYYNELKKLLAPKKSDIILDYGGGNGEIAYRFYRDGFIIEHCDINKTMVKNAQYKYGLISFHCDSLNKHWACKNYSKIIFNNGFFYLHPKNQKKFLEFTYRLLTKGGMLFITDTPDFDKRKVVNGKKQSVFYIFITRLFPVYQVNIAGFWVKHKQILKDGRAVGYKEILKIDSWCDYRSHWVLKK